MCSKMIKQAEAIILSNQDNRSKNISKQLVNVIHCESPDVICVKFLSDAEAEDLLMKELQAHYTKEQETKKDWKSGDNCVVYDMDAKCYKRGVVVNRINSGYTVYLYDYMQENVFPKKNVYICNKYFHTYKKLIHKCKLANVKPAGDSGKWSALAEEILQKITSAYKTVYISEVENQKGNLVVDMWYSITLPTEALEPSKTKFVSISQILVETGVAISTNVEEYYIVDNYETNSEEASSVVAYVETIQNKSFIKSKEEIESSEKEAVESTPWYKLVEMEENEKRDEISNWLPPLPLELTEFDACLKCVGENGILYIRDLQKESDYMVMEEAQNSYFKSASLPTEEVDWQTDKMCTILYEDVWYRGSVKKVEANNVLVHMIDFGSDHEVKRKNIYRQVMYPLLPPFLNQIQLYNVVPKNGVWDPVDVNTLIDIITDDIKVVIKNQLDNDIPRAEVFDSSGNKINDLIVKYGTNLMHVYNKQDEEKIEEVVDAEDNCDNSEYSYKYKLDPSCFQFIDVYITSVISFDTIVIRERENEENEFTNSQFFEDLQEVGKDQKQLETFKVNEICVCPSEEGVWHRALIYETNEFDLNCGQVTVFFVDIGAVDMVKVQNIKAMNPDWLATPVYNKIAKVGFKLLFDKWDNVFRKMSKLSGATKLVQVISTSPLTVHVYESEDKLFYQNFTGIEIKIVDI